MFNKIKLWKQMFMLIIIMYNDIWKENQLEENM